jgi:hypothetical protein
MNIFTVRGFGPNPVCNFIGGLLFAAVTAATALS